MFQLKEIFFFIHIITFLVGSEAIYKKTTRTHVSYKRDEEVGLAWFGLAEP